VQKLGNNGLCPSGFFSDATVPAVCYSAVMNCKDGNGVTDTASLNFIYSQDIPTGSVVGTVVFLGGGGGEQPSSETGKRSILLSPTSTRDIR